MLCRCNICTSFPILRFTISPSPKGQIALSRAYVIPPYSPDANYPNLQTSRVTLRNTESGEETVLHLSKEQETDESLYKDKETGAELKVVDKLPLLEFLANSYKKFGCQLEFITNKSQVRDLCGGIVFARAVTFATYLLIAKDLSCWHTSSGARACAEVPSSQMGFFACKCACLQAASNPAKVNKARQH